MKRKSTKRYSLVFATIVAVLSVCTAGVSTMAWFQATANAQVATTTSTTTITVAAPDDTMKELFVYRANYAAGGSGTELSKKALHGASRPAAGAIAFDGMMDSVVGTRQFHRLSAGAGTNSYYTQTSSFAPGQTIHFAVLIHKGANEARTLKANAFVSATDSHRLLYAGGSTTKQFSLAVAINIYSIAIPGEYNSSTHAFTINSDYATANSFANTDDAVGQFISGAVESDPSTDDKFGYSFSNYNQGLPSDVDLSTHTESTPSTLFLYTIEFSNDESCWYTRVDGSSGSAIGVSPTSSEWANVSTYWEQSDTGDSEVFQGLNFVVSSLSVEAA